MKQEIPVSIPKGCFAIPGGTDKSASTTLALILHFIFQWHVLFVCSFCCLNNKNLFFTVLKADKSKIKVPADWVSGESPLPGLQTAVFKLRLHMLVRGWWWWQEYLT